MALQISCPVCRGNDARRLFSKGGYDFVECRNDKLVYVNPQPDRAYLKERYDAFATEMHVQPEYTDDAAEMPNYRDEFTSFRKTNRLLEVGAASGNFLVKCREDGWDVSGVELAGPSSEYARTKRGLNVLTGTIQEARFPADHFDVVAAWATLEHVPDPREVIEEVYRVLRPGGLFRFSVPNWGGASMRFLGPRHRYVDPLHLSYFSPRSAEILLRDVGFKAVGTSSLDFNPFVFWQDWRGQFDRDLKKHGDAWRPSRASEMGPRDALFKFFPRSILRSGYHFLSRTMGALHLGNILFAEGVK